MPKTPRATLLIEKSEHGTDYTLKVDGIELDILIVDYETEHYEDEDTTRFDGHEAVITYEVPNRDHERVDAAQKAHDELLLQRAS